LLARFLVTAADAEHEVAAGCQRVHERRCNVSSGVGIEEVQDQTQDQGNRLAGMNQVEHGRIRKDADRVAHVASYGVHIAVFEQRFGVRQHHGVIVNIHHPAGWFMLLRNLVGVLRGWQAGTNVEKLPDATTRQPRHGPTQKQPVLARQQRQLGVPVSREVVFTERMAISAGQRPAGYSGIRQ